MTSKAKRRARRVWTSTEQLTCNRCAGPIPAGQPHYRDQTRAPSHRDCQRLKLLPARPPLQRDYTGQTCAGCSDVVGPDEQAVGVNGNAWHRDCRLREQVARMR